MYRRSRQSRPSLLLLIVFAAVAGAVYVMLDNAPASISSPVPVTETRPPEQAAAASATRTLPPPTPLTREPTAEAQNASVDYQPVIPDDARLIIPSAAINARVVQAFLDGVSWDVSRLGRNVGHLQGTAWVGQSGNIVLSGHVETSDGRGGVFRNLGEVSVDDLVLLNVAGEEWVYVVTEITKTAPDDLSPVMPTTSDRLTLITCDSYDFLSDSYLERTIVVAQRVD